MRSNVVLWTVIGMLGCHVAYYFLSPGETEAEQHFRRGSDLEAAGRLDEAIVEYRAAHADGLYPMMTGHIAGLLEAARRFEDALAEIDREGPRKYCSQRAHCLEAWKGIDAAEEWLTEKDREDPTDPFFQLQIGWFHVDAGRPNEAVDPLLEAEQRALVRQRLHWSDANDLLDDEGSSHDVNDLCDLWPTLELLCQAYEELGDDERAWQYASRAVSLGRRIHKLKGYFGEKWQTAGSFIGRMVRARVLLRHGDLDMAAIELEYAEEAMSPSYPPHGQELADARAEIENLRTFRVSPSWRQGESQERR
jgi:tetratricopeptide (TPR) repeat protein